MISRASILSVSILLTALGCAGSPAHAGKFYVGGGFGLGFGDVEWVDVNGQFGYLVTPRVTTGVRVSWRNREDGRFEPDVTTNDYGAGVFARFYPKRPFFVQVEYEYLNYEFIRPDRSTERESFDSVLVGGGVAQPLGQHVFFYASALYNLSYDSGEPRSPYDSPLVLRAGVGYRF